MSIILKNKETLIFEDFKFDCSVGENGLTKNKFEGDKKTPKGSFKIGNLYYRKDRLNRPNTNLKCITIKKNMGWCDDPKDEKSYNKLIKINKRQKFEKLYRVDNKYDLVIPILYNTKNIVPYKGSAIFLHLTKNYNSTNGCIALKKNDFLILLKLIKKNTKIKIS